MTMPTMLLLAALAAPGGQALAQADPTRPPAVLSAPPPGTAVALPAQDVQVQSILVSQRGRRIAVIDGKTVREGQRVDGAVVEAIRPTEVVIRRGARRKTLKLFRPAEQVAADQP
jgi:MSHA biogenesis protein MshK